MFTAENSRESETFGHSSPELIFLKSLLHPAIFGSIVLPAIHPWELVWALPPGWGQQLHTWRSSTLCTHQNWVFPAPSPCQSPGQPPLRSLVTSWSQASSINTSHSPHYCHVLPVYWFKSGVSSSCLFTTGAWLGALPAPAQYNTRWQHSTSERGGPGPDRVLELSRQGWRLNQKGVLSRKVLKRMFRQELYLLNCCIFQLFLAPKPCFSLGNACKSLQNIYLWCPASVTFSLSNRGQGACVGEAGPWQPIRGQDAGHMITADQWEAGAGAGRFELSGSPSILTAKFTHQL